MNPGNHQNSFEATQQTSHNFNQQSLQANPFHGQFFNHGIVERPNIPNTDTAPIHNISEEAREHMIEYSKDHAGKIHEITDHENHPSKLHSLMDLLEHPLKHLRHHRHQAHLVDSGLVPATDSVLPVVNFTDSEDVLRK